MRGKTVTMDTTGKPLEYSVSRSDAYRMSIELVQQNKIKADETAAYTNIMLINIPNSFL